MSFRSTSLGLTAMVAISAALSPASAAEAAKTAKAPKAFVCAPVPTPVVALSYGSRYTADSKTRSDLDEDSDAEVNKELKPVDDFIAYLSKVANDAQFKKDGKAERIACIGNSLADWAKAGALTELDSLNANISVGGRFAGIAIAVHEAEKAGPFDPATKSVIDTWLKDRGEAMSAYFDAHADMNATKNNLRAWTGLAVGTIGLVVDDPALLKWGQDSFQLVACQASPDGSLPLEMGRAGRALGYQIHAVSPLVLSAVLFASDSFDGFKLCNGALEKIVDFTVAAAKDPTIVETITGKPQVFEAGDQIKTPFTMAWAEPYLAHVSNPELDAFVAPLRPLSNSKLGGNLTQLYPKDAA